YTNDEQAVQVLTHLAFLLRDQDAASVVAAFHTLSTKPEDATRAFAIIRQTLASQHGWRWRSEVTELY
ncbi:MAG: hypothetical protein GWN58_11900, partial [Anaerolineae bacterium]|nr:hypothetical protein [Anaerolineae bacterium]